MSKPLDSNTGAPSKSAGARTPIMLKPVRLRPTMKGRRVDPAARAELRALLDGDGPAQPRRRDLLIEYLHRIQDARGHLSDRHLVALADDMGIAIAEVYEVASFYHHFDIVREGEAVPAALTVRVCNSIACDLAGSAEWLRVMLAITSLQMPGGDRMH